MDMLDGDEHGDINEYWRDRDHNKDASKVKASVFVVHGFQDDNVRMDHVGLWWEGLRANNVPRKMWLLRAGHTDPFEQRRAEWVDTLHRWFDYWLQGINNGIGAQPKVTIEDAPNVWKEYGDWPIPGTQHTDVYLRGGSSHDGAGTLGGISGGTADTLHVPEHRRQHQREHADEHARGPADEPSRVPLADPDQGRPPVRHRRPEAAGRPGHHAEQPLRGHRRHRHLDADLAPR